MQQVCITYNIYLKPLTQIHMYIDSAALLSLQSTAYHTDCLSSSLHLSRSVTHLVRVFLPMASTCGGWSGRRMQPLRSLTPTQSSPSPRCCLSSTSLQCVPLRRPPLQAKRAIRGLSPTVRHATLALLSQGNPLSWTSVLPALIFPPLGGP